MPSRWCTCRGCRACNTATGTHGILYDMDTARGLKCPPCQQATDQRTEQRRTQQRGTAAQRGYDARHRALRATLLAQWQPGDPCAHCGQPMLSKDGLDLAHTGDRTGYRGLAHAECNRGNR